MNNVTSVLLTALLCVLFTRVSAQTLSITYQNPSGLYVCGSAAFTVSLQNNQSAPLSSLAITVDMPNGISYAPGSVNNATETNVADPNAPVFGVNDLAPGAQTSFDFTLQAGCELVDAINSGQLFNNIITVNYTGGSEQITTLAYPVGTALLLITNVTPFTQSGKKGDVLTRKITLRNTRQGPVNTLYFFDQHLAGLSVNLNGVGGQNSTPTLFDAVVPGTYFTAFGDGDELFEFNETVTLTEEITIDDCGTPSFTNPSMIRIGWGCDGSACQSDSAMAEVVILPSDQNPDLVFTPVPGLPVDRCAQEASVQELIITNNGLADAANVLLDFSANNVDLVGIDYNSFEINSGAGWAPLSPNLGEKQPLPNCGVNNYYKRVLISVPLVPAGATVRVRFNTYTCLAACSEDIAAISYSYFYHKQCPATANVNGSGVILPDPDAVVLRSKVYFDIGECLEDDQVYTFDYWVKSPRLLSYDGYLHLNLELPWGLFWENSCTLELDGKMPLAVDVQQAPNVQTIVRLVFELPMSSDSVFGSFCLRNICQPTDYYEAGLPLVPARGGSYTVYPVASSRSPCLLDVNVVTQLSTSEDVNDECGISVCDSYELVLNCGCNDNSCTGNGGLSIIAADYTSWRTNIGLQDDNNDRFADSNAPATTSLIRLDRFLPGDTMRTRLRGVVLVGDVGGISFRAFTESWKSDFGIDGGDPYEIPDGQKILVNYDSLEYIGGSLYLKIAATGATYTCPVPAPPVRSDQLDYQIAEPNIRPEQIYDELTSMFHQYDLSFDDFAAMGCLPPNLVLQPGDSLVFTADYKFRQNFVPPFSPHVPSLINFRNTICSPAHRFAWKLDGCFPPHLRQYSGYQLQMANPSYSIQPCTLSKEVSPFYYHLRIARANLFPYEVRPLASLLSYSQSLPPGVPLLETRLHFLQLQESVPLFNDELVATTAAGGLFKADLSTFFSTPLDEGWRIELGSQFGPECSFTGPVAALTEFRIRYANMCFHDPELDTVILYQQTGYYDAKPRLDLVPEDTIITVPSRDFLLNLSLNNLAPAYAPNTWVALEGNSDLSGLELVYWPSGQAVPSVGGVYQLGKITPNSQSGLQLRGQSVACEPVELTLHYGWDCDPVTNTLGSPCSAREQKITLLILRPELELVLLQQPVSVPMCAPSDYFEFEVYNANEGYAFSTTPSIKLPQGMSVVPGSSQLSYPVGTSYVALPDPKALPGNVYQWDPAKVSAALLQYGLLSINQAPQNALRVRFRVLAECGFVSNTQPVYGAEALQPCGISSNVLRVPGNRIQSNGVNPSYGVSPTLAFADPGTAAGCGEEVLLEASMVLQGVPAAGDSIYLLLPQGITYVAGSYQAGPNAPAGPPQQIGSQLQLPLPAGLPAGSNLRFFVKVRYDDPAGCDDKIIVLQTREQAQAFCPSSNTNCDVYVATGEALLFFQAQNPGLILKNESFEWLDPQLHVQFELANAGPGQASNPLVELFLDQNGNGKVDAGEPLVATVSGNDILPAGSSLQLSAALNLPVTELCRLLARIPAGPNCACADRLFRFDQHPVIHTAKTLCELLPVSLRVDSIPGAAYTWQPAPGILSCTQCAQTTFTPGPGVQTGDVVTVVLTEATSGCTVERRFDIRFGGELGLTSSDRTICQGDTIHLDATPGDTYQWSGPGISNPALQTQVLQPLSSGTYAVTVTLSAGCSGVGQIMVTVLPRDTIDLGRLVTCTGNPVNVFGTLTDVPGVYMEPFPQPNGCEGVQLLLLEVLPNLTTDQLPLCTGDTIAVFDSLVTDPGVYCRSFSSSLGCDSVHCITVTQFAPPDLPAQDTVILEIGQQTTLNAPPGYPAYLWTPSTYLNCDTCPNPVASPPSSISYWLTVHDGNGCPDSVEYRILVFPPCNPGEVRIPNAFTPDGDGNNDVFTAVPLERLEMVVSLQIYTRWGEKVYEAAGTTVGWDGTVQGKPAPSDVYVWVMEIECSGERTPVTGDVTLLR